jgi:hypothetical protein
MPEQNQTSAKVPVNSRHRLKVISSENPEVLEKETNEFLGSISDEKLLVSMTFLSTNNVFSNFIYYRELFPMTQEDWEKKLETQRKFSTGFIPKELLPSSPEVTKL